MVSLMSSSGGLPSITHQEMLDNVARLVDKHMQEDQNYLDLSDLLKTPSTNQPSVSGLNDVDYPCLLDTHLGLDSLTEVSDSKLVPLPPELVEQYSRMQCNCTMGMFPEIGRAWLTIDSDIFVWRFEDGSDLAYFDGLSETILSVALVKPKQGIFQAHIQYLLCLATPVDIVLLAVSFSKPHDDTGSGSQSEMHLLPDPLFSIPTDNTYIMSITGTANGRIFMAGKDGCLYELVYQADDGWFSRKCRKVNHSTSSLSFLVPSFLNFSFSEDDPLLQLNIDESRHILYARSEKGTIQVFDLGKDGKGMGKVASVPLQTIVLNAAHIARTIERSNFKPIVHISAVTQSESANINLVAVTQSGVRLYFSTGSFNSPKSRPSTLTLVHVRLPPGFTASAMVHKPTQVHTAFHKQGTLMLVSSQTDDSDLIWVVSCDSFPFQNQLMEAQMCKPLNGRTWSVCEVAPKTLDAGQQLRGLDTSRPNPPAVVTQHAEMPRKFILLTTQGCHIMNKLRPVDQLRQLLIDCQGPDSDEVKGFFKLHKIEQACATCLILATSKFASDQAVSSWATMAFFNNGGEPQYTFGGTGLGMDKHLMPSNIGPGGLHPSQTSTPAAGVGHSYYHPSMPPNPNMGHDVMFSGKHNGICLYLSRILRSVWDMNVVSDVPCNTSQGIVHYITCTFPTEELNQLLENIRGLSDFMDFNSRYNSGPSDGGLPPLPLTPHVMGGWMGMDDQMKKKLQGDAQKIEDISLQNLQELIHRVEEVLGLLKVLVDHQFHVIIGSLNQDIQSQLLSMSFKQLIVSGKDLCNSLITCLINRYLQDNATIDSINKCLRETCPSLYSVDDATCSKANELLQAARINQNKHERRQQLNEALKLYKDVTNPLQLPVVCSQFANVNFYDGIVDLCLTLASKRDPQQLALHYYQRGEQIDDIQGQMAYVQRMECYNCITDMLGYLLSSTGSHPNLSQGQQTELNILNAADVEQYKSEVFRLVLKSEDELFHVALYDWLFKEQLTEKLLEIQSPFIEPYLKRRAGYQPDSVSALDMLWKYYEKNRHFPAAAKILSRLAEKHGTDVNLQQRMEYLSRAIMCAKSSTSRSSSATEGEFLHELEEKMEVARLQLQVQKSISRLRGNPVQIQEGVSRLDCDLMDLTTLYEEFADKFGLQESKLAIVHCAGLSDGALVESLWQGIIEKELNSTVNMTQQLKITNLKTKLIPLGKQYINTERYFPKVFLVRIMEQKSCLLDFPASCVFEMMLEIGVSPIKLMEIYDRMFKSRDPFWQTIQKPLHLLDVLCELLSHLAKSMNTIPPYERRHFITMCLDCMAAYLVELQAMRINDHQRRLISSFKRLQAELERL